jgi:hypothetical protein
VVRDSILDTPFTIHDLTPSHSEEAFAFDAKKGLWQAHNFWVKSL